MTKFVEGLYYKCISKGPIMVRKDADEHAQAISVIRPNAEVKCLGMKEGIIFKIPVDKSFRQDNVWMKTDKGYVRVVSLNGTKEYFELLEITEQGTVCTPENTSIGDTVMVTVGAVNSFGVKPEDSFYAPEKHKVLNIDSTNSFLYIGSAMDNGTWFNISDGVLVSKASGK